MYKVTIVLPIYNGEKYLAETIDSVLNQTFSDFELLVIDDASTDASAQIVQSYTDDRIRYIKNEINLGPVASPQKAMDRCETMYIARIDQDDIWLPEKLEKQIKILDEHPGIGICGTSVEWFGDRTGIHIFPERNDELKAWFLFGCCMSHPSVVFRRSFLTETGIRYTNEYRYADDYKMWIDCIDHTQIYNIPEPLVRYRQHDEQICAPKNQEKQLLVKNKVRKELILRIQPNLSEKEIEFHIEKYVDSVIDSAADIKHFIRWRKTLLKYNLSGNQYVNPLILKKILDQFNQIAFKKWIITTYFKTFNLHSFLKYFLSFNWKYLTLRRNLKLLYQCIK